MASETKLVRGVNNINLSASPFSTGAGFAPPAVNMSYNISSGTSANVSGGGSLISQRANNIQFSFQVRIDAGSYAVGHALMNKLSSFIGQQSNDALFLEYRTNAAYPAPLWGQFGAPRRYEVVTGHVSEPDSLYSDSRGNSFFVTVSLEIKPFPLGQKQKLINATGGIFENTYGSVDGTSKSLSIFEATTNKMTNPVFGHSTFGHDWTFGADLTVTQNTDERFCLPGLASSAKISANAGSTCVAYQSINAGNTNKHSFIALVYRPNFGAVSNTICSIFYNTTIASSYQDLGNGLWLVYADNIDGINSAKSTGLVTVIGRTVYLLAFQMEEKAYHTPLAYGDMMGCAWTGTAHASTSTRTAAVLSQTRTDEYLNLAQGGVAVVWKPYFSNAFGTSISLFGTFKSDNTANGIYAYFDAADDKIKLTDGNATALSAAQTFSAGDTLYLAFTWGPGGINIYKNGVNIATYATYTIPSITNAAVYSIGNRGTAFQAGDFLGYDVFDTELSVSEAAAIYADQSAIVASGKRPSLIPWLYTATGTGLVYNHDDAAHDNWAVAGGIAGSWEADTFFDMAISGMISDLGGMYLSKLATSNFVTPSGFYGDPSGSVDATASGGYAVVGSFADGAAAAYSGISKAFSISTLAEIVGREFYPLFRLKDAGGTRSQKTSVYLGYSGIETPYKSFAATTSYTLFQAQPLRIPFVQNKFTDAGLIPYSSMQVYVTIRRDTGATQDWYVDYVNMLFRPLVHIKGGTNGRDGLLLNGGNLLDYAVSGRILGADDVSMTGDVIELTPGKYNNLVTLIGDALIANDIASTVTHSITITPRYTLA